MKRWEYQVIKFELGGLLGGIVDNEEMERILNRLGDDGWELVGTTGTTMQQGATRDLIGILKREVEPIL
ncbi:DUF4177 domain-containing protein [Deinococcus sp.]|uniref:DUF4177 domain-containing protein n=1 Tax=Deinococcus sp. TaxID=47478 RepID=UPI003B58ED5B